MAYLGYPACTECAFPITVSRVQNPEKKKRYLQFIVIVIIIVIRLSSFSSFPLTIILFGTIIMTASSPGHPITRGFSNAHQAQQGPNVTTLVV
jgi:hypothetical protein